MKRAASCRLLAAIGIAAVLSGCGGQAAATAVASHTASPALSAVPTIRPAPTPSPSPAPTFPPIDLLATPTPPPPHGALPTDQVDSPAPRRPVPAQSAEWLALKAAGRIALVDGQVIGPPSRRRSAESTPATGVSVPAVAQPRDRLRPLDRRADRLRPRRPAATPTPTRTTGTCANRGPRRRRSTTGSSRTGHPNVTGTEGWFLDPYEAEGRRLAVARALPSSSSGGKRIGTYWSGTDAVNGYTAHGRGYIMYLGMEIQPPGWRSKGIPVYADARGRPLYPTIGAPRTNIQVALNWEASGHHQTRLDRVLVRGRHALRAGSGSGSPGGGDAGRGP